MDIFAPGSWQVMLTIDGVIELLAANPMFRNEPSA
jgi:hypothetical protein